jgi:hypothetical protein
MLVIQHFRGQYKHGKGTCQRPREVLNRESVGVMIVAVDVSIYANVEIAGIRYDTST